MNEQVLVLVHIQTNDGFEGWGEATTIGGLSYAEESPHSIKTNSGLKNACLIGQIATMSGIDLYGGTMLEGPIGTIASAHAFSTFPSLAFDTELFGPLLLTESILKTPLDYKEFGLNIPNTPGLGIDVDKEKVYRLAQQANL